VSCALKKLEGIQSLFLQHVTPELVKLVFSLPFIQYLEADYLRLKKTIKITNKTFLKLTIINFNV
jgi:hypothetical protein